MSPGPNASNILRTTTTVSCSLMTNSCVYGELGRSCPRCGGLTSKNESHPGRSVTSAGDCSDRHDRLPPADLGRVEDGIADGLGGQRLAERGAGRLTARKALEEVGHLVHEGVLVA